MRAGTLLDTATLCKATWTRSHYLRRLRSLNCGSKRFCAPPTDALATSSTSGTASFLLLRWRVCRPWLKWCASSGWRRRQVPKQAVLLLAHGTPETVEQIPEYLRNVVSGRPLPQAVIEEIQHRYALIGRSPLTEITLEQGRLVGQELAAAGPPGSVYVAMRNWRPYIPEVVRQMRIDGVEEAAVICMAPQNSRTSVGLYRRAVEAEAAGLRIDFTEGWARHPLLAEGFAERLRPALGKLSGEVGHSVPVLFTA